jgi:hypothetical protein
MVVARKYVLEYQCKQIFEEMVPSMKTEEKTVQFSDPASSLIPLSVPSFSVPSFSATPFNATPFSAFVSKPKKTFLEKKINQFLYLGAIPPETPVLEKPKPIHYSEYLKMCQILADLKTEPEQVASSSIPDTQSIDSN